MKASRAYEPNVAAIDITKQMAEPGLGILTCENIAFLVSRVR